MTTRKTKASLAAAASGNKTKAALAAAASAVDAVGLGDEDHSGARRREGATGVVRAEGVG